VQRRNRRRARCLSDVSSTPANERPQCVPPRTCRYTRHRQAAGSVPLFRCTNVSAATTTHAEPSMPADTPTTIQEKEPDTATTLGVADATIVARTRVRAPACQAPRPSVGTSSMLLSHQGTDYLPISLSTQGRQTLDFASKTIDLPIKPVARMMTISLFTISYYSWPIRREHGWSIYRPMPSRVGRI